MFLALLSFASLAESLHHILRHVLCGVGVACA